MYCSNCGNRLNDTDRFCGKCGKKIIVQKKRKIEKPVFNKIPQALSMLQGKKINSKHILFFLKHRQTHQLLFHNNMHIPNYFLKIILFF